MKDSLLTALYTQMSEGVYPADFQGICQVELTDDNGSTSGFFGYFDNELHYFTESPGRVDVAVHMRAETLADMLARSDKFDLRYPEFVTRLTAEGNLDLGAFLFAMIKRPPKDVTNMMTQTLAKTVGYKDSVTEIQRVHKPTEEQVVELMSRSVPFVITGAVDNWPFLSMTLDEVKNEYGDVALRPNVSTGDQETFRDFIEKMEGRSGDTVYTYGCPLPLPIWAEFPLPFFDWDLLTTPQIWAGTKTGDIPCTNLHRDCTHGMLAQLFGRKKLIMFSPDQSDYLYPVPAFNTYQPCRVQNVLDVDLQQFPQFRHAKPVEVTIAPGEILVIPAFWYHCVFAVDNVFSVSFGLLWSSWKKLQQTQEVA